MLSAAGRIPPPTITAAELAELSPSALLARAISMIVARIGPVGLEGRNEIVRGLDPVRGAVFGYAVVHDHGRRGVSGLCAEVPHRVADPSFFPFVLASLSEIGAVELLELMRDAEAEIIRAGGLDDLDPEALRLLDERHAAGDATALDHLAHYVRAHADQLFTVLD